MLSIIIPTQGRATLERTLESIGELIGEDEVIVVIDAYQMDDTTIQQIVDRVEVFGRGFRCLAFDTGHHCFGHCQLNHGIEAARGEYLVFNDDDDIFADGVLGIVRIDAVLDMANYGEPFCHIYKFVTPWGNVLPESTNLFEGGIGGHCIVTPNVNDKVGRFTCRYAGDWDYIADTVSRWPAKILFHDTIIARTRP